MSKIIYNNNKRIMANLNWKNKETKQPPCNCRIKEKCPLNGNCNQENVVYHVNIFSKKVKFNNETYIGI